MDRSDAYNVGDEIFYINKYAKVRKGEIFRVKIEEQDSTNIEYRIKRGATRLDYIPHERVGKTKEELKNKIFK